jgi:hypothetical protein
LSYSLRYYDPPARHQDSSKTRSSTSSRQLKQRTMDGVLRLGRTKAERRPPAAAITSTIKAHMTASNHPIMIKLSLLLVLSFSARSHAFVAQNRQAAACQSLAAVPSDSQDHATRRDVIYKSLTAGIVTFGGAGLFPSVALAKVCLHSFML